LGDEWRVESCEYEEREGEVRIRVEELAHFGVCEAAGFARRESRKDLAGRDRFVLAWH
jgi:hypothetical protein